MGVLDKIRNFWFSQPNMTTKSLQNNDAFKMAGGGSESETKNLNNTAVPVQFNRDFYDIAAWRRAISEAEQLPYPFRVRMQRIYIDVVNNGHVKSCIEKRKNLILCKEFEVVDEKDEFNDEWTKYIQASWFRDYVSNCLDALFYGYSLISIGDIEKDYNLKNMTIIRRWLVSPDRLNVANLENTVAGTPFMEGEVADWHVWVKTPSDIGVSGCGYGLLYSVALAQIVIKDNLSYNLTYNELFGSPLKVLKSSATDPESRQADIEMLESQGNAAGMVIRLEDELEFVEAKGGGGFKSYADLEKRYQDEITAIILGHRTAIDAIPGQLGNSGEDSAAGDALKNIESSDTAFVMPYFAILFDKLRLHGVPIPEGMKVRMVNSIEADTEKEKTIKNLLDLSNIAANFTKAGLTIDMTYLEEISGIKFEKTVTENNI